MPIVIYGLEEEARPGVIKFGERPENNTFRFRYFAMSGIGEFFISGYVRLNEKEKICEISKGFGFVEVKALYNSDGAVRCEF